ncbi:MAG: hypothetical protein AAGN35_23130 [Bacteroidota bacterium]
MASQFRFTRLALRSYRSYYTAKDQAPYGIDPPAGYTGDGEA